MSNKRQNILIQILAFMFTAGGCIYLYEAASKSDWNAAFWSLGIICFTGFIGWYCGKSDEAKKEPNELLSQIQKNSFQIKNGGWLCGKILITPQTNITQYFVTISIVAFCFKIPSRFYMVGEESDPHHQKWTII